MSHPVRIQLATYLVLCMQRGPDPDQVAGSDGPAREEETRPQWLQRAAQHVQGHRGHDQRAQGSGGGWGMEYRLQDC